MIEPIVVSMEDFQLDDDNNIIEIQTQPITPEIQRKRFNRAAEKRDMQRLIDDYYGEDDEER